MDKVLSIKLEKMARTGRKRITKASLYEVRHEYFKFNGYLCAFLTVLSDSRKNSPTNPYNCVEARSMLSLCLDFP